MSGFELESVNQVFMGSLRFRWDFRKSPKIVANNIKRSKDFLDSQFRDMLFPMVAARQIMVEDIADRFDREVDLKGQPWKELNKNYATWKEKKAPGKKIMALEDTLYEAVTDESAYPIVGNEIFVDTSGFPPYWAIHNFGGQTSGFGGKFTDGARQGIKMPKRSFLGVSEQAAFAIHDVFEEWIGGILDIVVDPLHGIAHERVALGRIGPKIGMGRPTGRIAPIGIGMHSGAGIGLVSPETSLAYPSQYE